MQTKKATLSFRVLLIAAFTGIFYLATTALRFPVIENINDKVNHALAFFALALLADFSWPRSGFTARKILSLLGYGLVIEIAQYFLPYRAFSLFDLGADALGLFLYWMTVPLLRKLPLLKSRWNTDVR